MLSDLPGVVDIVERAAAAEGAARRDQLGHAALVPELHGHADHGRAAAVQQTGDGRAVHAAAHGDRDEIVAHMLILADARVTVPA